MPNSNLRTSTWTAGAISCRPWDSYWRNRMSRTLICTCALCSYTRWCLLQCLTVSMSYSGVSQVKHYFPSLIFFGLFYDFRRCSKFVNFYLRFQLSKRLLAVKGKKILSHLFLKHRPCTLLSYEKTMQGEKFYLVIKSINFRQVKSEFNWWNIKWLQTWSLCDVFFVTSVTTVMIMLLFAKQILYKRRT